MCIRDRVKLLRDGEVVRMSKRTGKAISLHDLLDEVPVDAARWYFNAKPDTQMEFDLGLAVREDSENPIYYVEYAHARICSLLRALESDGVSVPEKADLSPVSYTHLYRYCQVHRRTFGQIANRRHGSLAYLLKNRRPDGIQKHKAKHRLLALSIHMPGHIAGKRPADTKKQRPPADIVKAR